MSRKAEQDRRLLESQLAGKMFCISVIGLSGTAKDQGCLGVGKSCLCNRFIRQQADEYNREHISVLAQSDFNGPIVNNEHWLYWGQTRKCTEEGFELTFSIVEQTEFVDDACFQPFRSGKMDPYYKRCASTKLTSAEKLMYICKNQLGIEKEYEQVYLPDGRFLVDGFVVVFDVSDSNSRDIARQVDMTGAILANCLKTKKPVVLVTTKNDEASPVYVKEAERLVNRKEFKGLVPIVETSAHDNVNVDMAFWACVQRDWPKGKSRLFSFDESFQRQRNQMGLAEDAYKSLIRAQITDYRVHWNNTYSNLSQSRDFLRYCDLFGQESAQMTFKRHVKKLREDYVCRKMQMYLRVLPKVLATFLPDLDSFIPNDSWPQVQQQLSTHPLFDAHFVMNTDVPWQDIDDSLEPRIPYDILSTPEAEKVYVDHRDSLMREEHLRALRHQFAELLRETPIVPGEELKNIRLALAEHECVVALPDSELVIIYEDYQRLLSERAKEQLQELFQERASLFLQYCTGAVVTQEDLAAISKELMDDERWAAMDLLAQDRDLALIRHLGFAQWPIKEHCPAFHACVDINSEAFCSSISKRARHPLWNSSHDEDLRIKFTVFGVPALADSLCTVVKAMKSSIEQENQRVFIDVQVSPNNDGIGLFDSRHYPGSMEREGYIFVYSNRATFEHVRKSLEQSLLTDLQFATAHQPAAVNLPLILLLATSQECSVKDRAVLREEGHARSQNLQAAFFDVTSDEPHARFKHDELSRAVMFLTDSVARRADLMHIYNPAALNPLIPEGALNPEVRILLCMMCGDPLVPSHLLEMLLLPHSLPNTALYPVSKHSIVVDVGLLVAIADDNGHNDLSTLDVSRIPSRYVEFVVSSYHGSYAYKEELIHGYVLVYWSKRQASFANMSSLALNIGPVMPIQILALVENESRPSKLSHQLVAEGGRLAENLNANFNVSTLSPDLGRCVSSFLSYALANKLQIEKDMQINPIVPIVAPDMDANNGVGGGGGGVPNESYDPSFAEGFDESSLLVSTNSKRASSKHVATASFDDSQFPLYENNSVHNTSNNSGVSTDRNVKPSLLKQRRNNLHNYYSNLQAFPSADSLDRLYGPNGVHFNDAQTSATSASFYPAPHVSHLPPHPSQSGYGPSHYRSFGESELANFDSLAYGAIQQQQQHQHQQPPIPPRPASSNAHSLVHHPPPYSRVAISPPPAYGGYGMSTSRHQPPYPAPEPILRPDELDPALYYGMAQAAQEFYGFEPTNDAYRTHSAAMIYATTGRGAGVGMRPSNYHQFLRNDDDSVSPYAVGAAAMASMGMGASSSSMIVDGTPDLVGGASLLRQKNIQTKKKRTRRQHHRSSRSVSSSAHHRSSLGAEQTTTPSDVRDEDDDEESISITKRKEKRKTRRRAKEQRNSNQDDDSEDIVGDEDDDDDEDRNQDEIDDDDDDDDYEEVNNDNEHTQSSPSADEQLLQPSADKLGAVPSAWSFQQQRNSPQTPQRTIVHHRQASGDSLNDSRISPNERAKPGRLNLKEFNDISNAIGRFSLSGSPAGPTRANASFDETTTANSKKSKIKNRKGTVETESDSEASTAFVGSSLSSAFTSLRPGSSTSSKHSGMIGNGNSKLHSLTQKKQNGRNRVIPIVPVVAPPRAFPATQANSATNSSAVTPTSGIGKSVTGSSFDDKTDPSETALSLTFDETSNGDAASSANGTTATVLEFDQFADQRLRRQKLMSKLFSLQSDSTEPPSAFADDVDDSYDETEKKQRAHQLPKSKSGTTELNSSGTSKKEKKSAEKKNKKSKEEDKKVRKASKDARGTRSRSKSVNQSQQQSPLEEFVQSNGNEVPLFVELCTQFIELEGLDMEGIYRVPGNRAHVDALLQAFAENPDINIHELDIPVNAVATALKDFFMKQLPPIFPDDSMSEIAEVARIYADTGNMSPFERFLQKLPRINYAIIRFMIHHFVKIVSKSAVNSMDSKNLAICWWPTLLQFEFSDMFDFEQKRPHLMNFVQILIDSNHELLPSRNHTESPANHSANLSADELASL